MPLIDCTVCNSKISDRANKCPKCGHKPGSNVEDIVHPPSSVDKTTASAKEENSHNSGLVDSTASIDCNNIAIVKNNKNRDGITLLLVCAVLISILVGFFYINNRNTATTNYSTPYQYNDNRSAYASSNNNNYNQESYNYNNNRKQNNSSTSNITEKPYVEHIDRVKNACGVVRNYYRAVESKDVDGAIDMYSILKKYKIDSKLIRNVAVDTEYYKIDQMIPVNDDTNDGNSQLTIRTLLRHKKYNRAEEAWIIDVKLVNEQNEWKIFSTPGKKV